MQITQKTYIINPILALSAVLLSTTAPAAVIDGTIYRTGGQAVGTPAPWYTSPSDAVQNSIGLHNFTVNSAGSITIDILSWEGNRTSPGSGLLQPYDTNGDGEIAFFDAMIRLYDANNILVAANDDSGSTFGDGSIYNRDSYLSLFLGAGNYLLAVSSWDLSNAEVANGSAMGSGPMTWNGQGYVVADHGDYRATLTGDITLQPQSIATVPEPTSIALLVSGLLGFAYSRRKSTQA